MTPHFQKCFPNEFVELAECDVEVCRDSDFGRHKADPGCLIRVRPVIPPGAKSYAVAIREVENQVALEIGLQGQPDLGWYLEEADEAEWKRVTQDIQQRLDARYRIVRLWPQPGIRATVRKEHPDAWHVILEDILVCYPKDDHP